MNTSSIKLLLIEDNPGDARLIQEELSGEFDIDVITVATLQDAFDSIKNNNISVILADLSLPDSTGIDTFLRIKEKTTNIPIIILSGNKDESLANMAKNKGAEDYLTKDEIDNKYIRKIIFNVIEKHSLLKELEKTRQELEKYKQIVNQNQK